MRTGERDWEAAAHFSLGRASMRAGDFVRAKEHFAKAAERTPTSAAAVHNLGVAELRLRAYTPSLIYLRQALELPANGEHSVELPARYNLVLALRYQAEQRSELTPVLGQLRADLWRDTAQDEALVLARRVLPLPNDDATRASALLLAAGILRTRNQNVTDLAAKAAIEDDAPQSVEAVSKVLGDEGSEPDESASGVLEQHVRTSAARKHLRVRYNRACYLAGLGSDASDPPLREPLWQAALDELDLALADGSLLALAQEDPALTTLLATDEEASGVLARHGAEPAPASGTTLLASLDAIGPPGAELLASAAIVEPLALVESASDAERASELAAQFDVPVAQIMGWASAARLVVALGASPDEANLLAAAGFSAEDVARAPSPRLVLGAIADVNARRSLVDTVPELWVVRSWIWRARAYASGA